MLRSATRAYCQIKVKNQKKLSKNISTYKYVARHSASQPSQINAILFFIKYIYIYKHGMQGYFVAICLRNTRGEVEPRCLDLRL